MIAYQPVKQSKISDTVADELENMIVQGILIPGERLISERELSQKLEVSRPSLREAIRRLVNKGLLEARQGGGTFVRNFLGPSLTDPLAALMQSTPSTAQDFLELRMTLDGIAAYYAALRATALRALSAPCGPGETHSAPDSADRHGSAWWRQSLYAPPDHPFPTGGRAGPAQPHHARCRTRSRRRR